MSKSSREKFEKWANEEGFDTKLICLKDGRLYASLETEAAWKAWQASQGTQPDKLRKAAEELLEHVEKGKAYVDITNPYADIAIHIKNLRDALDGN